MTIAAILGAKGGEVVSVGPATTVGEAVRLLHERRIGAVPVVEEGRPVGIFSERDLIRVLADEGAAALERAVGGVMSAPAITAEAAQPVLQALAVMTQRRVRHLPVTEAGAMVGIVSIGDLVKYRIDRIEADAAAMRDYIQSA